MRSRRTPRFADDLDVLTDLGNVGAISLQVLALLGYRKVLMVGVDGRLPAGARDDEDVNHFSDAYARGRKPLTAADQRALHRPAGRWRRRNAGASASRFAMRLPARRSTCFETCGFGEGLDWLAPTDAEARASL